MVVVAVKCGDRKKWAVVVVVWLVEWSRFFIRHVAVICHGMCLWGHPAVAADIDGRMCLLSWPCKATRTSRAIRARATRATCHSLYGRKGASNIGLGLVALGADYQMIMCNKLCCMFLS